MLLMENSSSVPPLPSFQKVPPGLTLPACKLPATSPLSCSSCPLHLSRLLPAQIRNILLPRPPSPLPPWLLPASVNNHFPRVRSASGKQFEHRGVRNYSSHPRCLTRFDRREYRQCSSHAYQLPSFFSQRSRGRRFSGVPYSASDSFA